MAKQENNMRLAEILSDLVSLRVCVRSISIIQKQRPSCFFGVKDPKLIHIYQDPKAALALVSARPSPPQDSNATEVTKEEQDADLKRAKDLLKLHYEVKVAHQRGELSQGLEEARAAVARAAGGG